jgi:hypothetical protein
MNQDTVKEKLQSIHESSLEYTVVFSGKKNKRVNGFYRWPSREITIHDKNFNDDEGKQNENLLMFTAIHELAHHVMIAEKGKKLSHSKDFWATFHDLLDIAEKKGVYKAEIDAETEKLLTDVRDISRQIAELQRDLGKVLIAIRESCKKNGLRYEDIVERKAQIGKKSAEVAIAAYGMGDQEIGIDLQTDAARQRNDDKRAAIISASREGKSVVQAKKSTGPATPVDAEDETESLIREKRRIERTVETLTRRLEELEEQLRSRSEL